MRVRLGDGLEMSDDSLQNGCFSLLVDPYCSIRHPLGPPTGGKRGSGMADTETAPQSIGRALGKILTPSPSPRGRGEKDSLLS